LHEPVRLSRIVSPSRRRVQSARRLRLSMIYTHGSAKANAASEAVRRYVIEDGKRPKADGGVRQLLAR